MKKITLALAIILSIGINTTFAVSGIREKNNLGTADRGEKNNLGTADRS